MNDRRGMAGVVVAIVGSSAGVAIAAIVARVAGTSALVLACVGLVVGALAGARALAQRLPVELDGCFARRKIAAVLWVLAVLLAIGNTARISVFMTDRTQAWASVFPPMAESARHQCLAAYVRAGELAARGHADLWTPEDYRGPNSGVTPDTTIAGMAPYMSDPFEYPPMAALAPRAAVAATHDYDLIRTGWYALSSLVFWSVFVALAVWIGGRAGATALLLAPVIALSFPLLFCLQWGQAHAVVLALAIGGMLLLARGRRWPGAALVAAAIAIKIFPGLLVIHLAVRRRWRDLAAVGVALVALVVLALAVLGTATFHAYVTHQLPDMASGAAFSYIEDNYDNYAPYGLAWKLAAFGVDAGRPLASTLAWVWGLFAVVVTALASRGERARASEAVLWLGILCLATLRSPFAPQYTGIGTLWLLAVAYGVAPRRRALTIATVVAWILLQGFPPMGSAAMQAALSLPSQLVTIAIAIMAVWPRTSRGTAPRRTDRS